VSDEAISQLTVYTTYHSDDELEVLDVHDLSFGASGTNKRVTLSSFVTLVGLVSTSGSYSQPAWLTSVLGSIVSGNIAGNAAGITGTITTAQISNLSSWAGSSAITTLGAVAGGTWQATAIGVTYGGTGANLSGTGGSANYVKQVSSGAALSVGTIAATDVPAAGSTGQLEYNASGTRTGTADWAIGSSGQIVGTAISAPSAAIGNLWLDSARGSYGYCGGNSAAGLPTTLGGVIWQALGTPTPFTAITNSNGTSALTSLLQSGTTIGSLTFPANSLTAGKSIRPYIWGTSTQPASPATLTIAFLVGGNIIWGWSALAVTQTTNGASLWVLGGHVAGACGFQVQSIGASGTIIGIMGLLLGNTSGSALGTDSGTSTGSPTYTYMAPVAQTINTTVANTMDFQIKYGSSVAGTTMQTLGGWVEVVG
jgi:hypothetical protein